MAKQKKGNPVKKEKTPEQLFYGYNIKDYWEKLRDATYLYNLEEDPYQTKTNNVLTADDIIKEAYPNIQGDFTNAEKSALYNLYSAPLSVVQNNDSNKNANLPDTFDSLNAKKSNIGKFIKPVVAAGSLLSNLHLLKKTKDEALKIKAPHSDAVIIQNRPVESLPPEIVNMYKKQLGNMTTKKTSDSSTNRIAEQMLALKKMKALDSLAAKQIEQLQRETVRHDKINAVNRKASIEARNLNIKNQINIQNKRAAIQSAYKAKQQDFINKWIEEAIVKPMAKRVSYNMGRETIQNNENWNRLQTLIINTENRLRLEPYNKALQRDLAELLNMQRNFTTASLPSYDESMNYLFSK